MPGRIFYLSKSLASRLSARSKQQTCRWHGISQVSYYKWQQKFGGMGVSDAKRLRLLEEENRKLKKLVAVQQLCALSASAVNVPDRLGSIQAVTDAGGGRDVETVLRVWLI